MDKIDEMLRYIQRTNPTMTRKKFIEELDKCGYSAKAFIFQFKNIKNSQAEFDSPLYTIKSP